jgi:hypothetical protein
MSLEKYALPAPSPYYLEYPVKLQPRYGYGKAPHAKLYEIINRNRATYKRTLESFLRFKDDFLGIALETPPESLEPCWLNNWLSALDSVTLYSFLCQHNPRRYFEIGSGWSTKFARKAITNHKLRARITSLDPYPRAEIDPLCDNVIREPLEDAELSVFDKLEAGDILFVDGSHHCCMNSDVAVFFLDVLPRLKAGVLVQFHDIFLPYDYPPEWKGYYSEQYLLAVYILAESDKFDIVLPNAFITNDAELSSILTPLWDVTNTHELNEGLSFWIQTR